MSDNNLESEKLKFEFYKHLTVVSTAAAVLVPPVADALNPGTNAPVYTLLFLSLSIVAGLLGMFFITLVVKEGNQSWAWLQLIASIPFCIGLVIFLFFVVDEIM